MKSTTLLSTILPLAAAVPNVTVVPLAGTTRGDCSSWPGWINTRDADVTAPFMFQVSDSDDPGINGLFSITHTSRWPVPSNLSQTVENVFLDVRGSRRFAKPVFRCFNGIVHMYSPEMPSVAISRDFQNAYLTLGEYEGGPGYKLEAYAHEIDGVRQPGVFLGTKGKTTWGFNYDRRNQEDCEIRGETLPDWYRAGLQGLEMDPSVDHRAYAPPEFLGFLKAVPA